MSSNKRRILTGAAALLAALILALALRTGTSLAHGEQLHMPDASQPPAVIAGTIDLPAGMRASMPMTGTASCPGRGKMCGGGMGQEMMGQHMMMGHGMMGRGMVNHGMMRRQMMHQGGLANGTGAAAAMPDTLGAASTGVPESFAAALAGADARRGQQLTLSNGCIGCHSLDDNMRMVGPAWHNLAETAAARVPQQQASEYLYTSIVRPNAYVAPGYLPNIMLQSYGQQLGEQELADIVKYLLTLE